MSSTESLPPRLSGDAPDDGSAIPDVLYRLTLRRRRILQMLLEAPAAVAVRELALRITATEAEYRDSSIADHAVETVRIELRQVDLPVLEDVDLVTFDRSAGVVETSDHPAFEEQWFRRLVRSDVDLDPVVESLASEHRFRVLDVLEDHGGWLTRSELAERIAAREPDGDVDELTVTLYHVHLPKLEDAGLLEREDPATDGDGPAFRCTCSTIEEALLRHLEES